MFEESVEPKQKKVMSEERKQVLREQLRKAREKKLANKNAREGKTVKEKPVEEIKMNIIPEEVEHEEYEEPVAPRTKKLVKKRVKIIEPEPESEEEMIDATDIIENLKKEIFELKKGKTSSADMDEIRALKEELKDIRDAARDYKKKKSEKPVEKKPIVEIATHIQQAPRFSTYKKSIWSNLL